MENRKVLADKTVGLKPSGIRKFFDLVSEMKDAISLGVGEPDFDTPWHIRDEGIYSLEKGRTFYTSNSGLKELRQEICNYMKRTQDIDYTWDKEVFITVGGSEAIDLMFRAMINEGDEVLIPQPSYVSYEPCAVLEVPPDTGRARSRDHTPFQNPGPALSKQSDRRDHGKRRSGGNS